MCYCYVQTSQFLQAVSFVSAKEIVKIDLSHTLGQNLLHKVAHILLLSAGVSACDTCAMCGTQISTS